ncbi:hypothetical protein ACA910_019701 [Epithemia clementina (nom. ined.)]
MNITVFAFLALLGLASTNAEGGDYSYNMTAANGPPNWANLNIAGNACGGNQQSPIALTTQGCETFNDQYVLSSGNCGLDDLTFFAVPNGVKATYDGACTPNRMMIPNVDGIYQAQQFHIHIKSEHTFDGARLAFELHVVHGLVEGSGNSIVPDGVGGGSKQFAVFGFALQAGGSSNSAFQVLLDEFILGDTCDEGARRMLEDEASSSAEAGSTKSGNLRKTQSIFNIYDLVSGDDFYHYGGGLTTPPCTEAVWFNIAKDPVIISNAQATSLTNVILSYAEGSSCTPATIADPSQGTARPVQPLNGRELQRICGKESTTVLSLTRAIAKCLLNPLRLGCLTILAGL